VSLETIMKLESMEVLGLMEMQVALPLAIFP
jgi:hypothetical protein